MAGNTHKSTKSRKASSGVRKVQSSTRSRKAAKKIASAKKVVETKKVVDAGKTVEAKKTTSVDEIVHIEVASSKKKTDNAKKTTKKSEKAAAKDAVPVTKDTTPAETKDTAQVKVKIEKKVEDEPKEETEKKEPVIIIARQTFKPEKPVENNTIKVETKASKSAKPAPKIQKFNIDVKDDEPEKTEVAVEVEKTPVDLGDLVEDVVETAEKSSERKASVIMPKADLSGVHSRMRSRTETKVADRPSAKELKAKAIDDAMRHAAELPRQNKSKKRSGRFMVLGWRRVALALACATAAVFSIVYFVNLNSPNIALKVAAMQTGIEASYPGYTPRDYSLTDITSENGKVSLSFKNAETGGAYVLAEEKSSWDSTALLNNYVKSAFGDDYTAVKEGGLTIYISGSNAAWVNGGVLYKIRTTSGSLTKKQIQTIATSL